MSRKDKQWLELCNEAGKIFSTCSRSQVFSVIVDEDQRIVSTGYNGVPSGMVHCVDGGCPRGQSTVTPGISYDEGPGICFAAHAEANALSNGDATRFPKATLYVNRFPCFGCARMIAGAGIRRVAYPMDLKVCYQPLSETVSFLEIAGVRTIGVWL